jgi:hypothetical protein
VYTKKTEYMQIPRYQNAGQNRNTKKITNKTFKNVTQLNYLRTTVPK